MSLQRVPDLDSLELLLQVASTGSLGRAGAAHGISQPAVTARIRSMEGLVGFALVARSARGSTLTPAGALLADWAREVLEAAAVLEAGIRSLRSDRDGRVRIAASMTVAEYLVPRWLVVLASAHPETAVSLTAMNSTEVGRAVLETAVELGFVEGPQIASGLAGQVIATDRLVVIVPPRHPWARCRQGITADSWPAPDWSTGNGRRAPAPPSRPRSPTPGPWRRPCWSSRPPARSGPPSSRARARRS
jgi:DNA-binding transcriptional LysR family regulator